MKPLAKVEAATAIVSFALIFICGAAGQFALLLNFDPKTVNLAVKCAILLFFLIFGFSCIGLLLHVFIRLQIRTGNGAVPMVRLLADHETKVTLAFWAFLGMGVVIAAPFALHDMVGLQPPIGASKGVLLADIGLTIDEVKQRSTLKFKEPRLMRDGAYLGVEEVVFDFQIGDSAMRFPRCRYYWLATGKADRHISVLNIGISPEKMSKPDLEEFQHRLQSQLLHDGWMPGHFLARSEETVRLWGGSRTAGDGRYWAKQNTLLIFEIRRMDEMKPNEPQGAGEYILYLDLRPKSSEPTLVFERSAWPG